MTLFVRSNYAYNKKIVKNHIVRECGNAYFCKILSRKISYALR
jgi:hypothetical protein